MQAWAPEFDASCRPPRVVFDRRLTEDDVAWLNRQLELIDKPNIRFACQIAVPPGPAPGYVPLPPSSSLLLPTERLR